MYVVAYLYLGQKTCAQHEILTWLVYIVLKTHEKAFSVLTSRLNISCRAWVFLAKKGTGGLQQFFDF